MKIFDLIDRGRTMDVMDYGYLEKYFEMSMCTGMKVKYIKVYTKTHNPYERMIILRYSYYDETDREKYEKYINKHYELVVY